MRGNILVLVIAVQIGRANGVFLGVSGNSGVSPLRRGAGGGGASREPPRRRRAVDVHVVARARFSIRLRADAHDLPVARDDEAWGRIPAALGASRGQRSRAGLPRVARLDTRTPRGCDDATMETNDDGGVGGVSRGEDSGERRHRRVRERRCGGRYRSRELKRLQVPDHQRASVGGDEQRLLPQRERPT